MADSLKITKNKEGFFFEVKVLPRSSKNEITGVVDGKMKVKLTQPPVDGKANCALIELIADKLGLRKNQVELVKGETSTQKQLYIHSTEPEIELKLKKLCGL